MSVLLIVIFGHCKFCSCRLVWEITNEYADGIRWQGSALLALQWASEAFMTEYLEDSNLCVIHAKCITIMPKDMILVRRIRCLGADDHTLNDETRAANQDSKKLPLGVYDRRIFKRTP